MVKSSSVAVIPYLVQSLFFRDKVFYQRSMGTAVPNSVSKIMSIQDSIEGWEVRPVYFIF